MLDMIRTIVAFTCSLPSLSLWASSEKRPLYPSCDYSIARAHETKPRRRTIPLKGKLPGFNQLRLTLTVSPRGDVVDADAGGGGHGALECGGFRENIPRVMSGERPSLLGAVASEWHGRVQLFIRAAGPGGSGLLRTGPWASA
jgi:hypothetical protein